MPLKLIYSKADVRPEDCDELVLYLKDGGNRECKVSDEGAERLVIRTRFLATGELEKLPDKIRKAAKAKKDGAVAQSLDESDADIARTIELVADAVVSITPNPIGKDGKEATEINSDVIRGLPDWLLAKIAEFMQSQRNVQKEQEGN